MSNKAFSTLAIKSFNEEEGILEGIASTPYADRLGDVMEAKGARFNLPIPFLWQHEKHLPIGQVIEAEIISEGIKVKVKKAEIDGDGELAKCIKEAWQAIKSGLVKGLSIGFLPIDSTPHKQTKGVHYKTWDWFELSAVTIPCNAQANITSVKELDSEQPSEKVEVVPEFKPAVDTAQKHLIVKTSTNKGNNMTFQEQIKSFEAERQAKEKALGDILTDAGTATLNEEQDAQYKSIEAEIKTIDTHLDRLNTVAKAQTIKATPVAGSDADEGAKSTQGAKIETPETMEKGIGFAQYARAKMIAALEAKNGNFVSPVQVAKSMGYSKAVQTFIEKATVGTTTDVGFASPLVDENRFRGDFIDLLRNASVFDKLSGYRNVPFNSKISGQLTGGAAQWVGEGAKKPLTNPTFGEVKIGEHKLAAITVYTQELMRRADPSIDRLVRDDLIAAASTLIDTTFLGAQAATDITPMGILNGVTAVPSTGVTAAAYEADILKLMETFVAANLSTDNSYILMSETRAMQMALLRDPLGNTYFNGMGLTGARSLLGIPVITSQSVGDKIIMIKMSEILVAQDGGVDVAYSDQATLVDGATTINLWQENKFAVRVEKFITWAKRRPIASAFINYGA